jgi:PKD repeat protein
LNIANAVANVEGSTSPTATPTSPPPTATPPTTPTRTPTSPPPTATPTPPIAPTAAFTFSCNGLKCLFDASTSTDDQGITLYKWDFGDGKKGKGVNVSHKYARRGTYTVRLTVRDASGQKDTAKAKVNAM